MTANKDLGRRLSDLYEAEAAPRAPDWLLEQSLEIIDTTRQRRVVIRLPWRLTTTHGFTKVAVAAVVVVAVGDDRPGVVSSNFEPGRRATGLALTKPFRQP